VTAGDLPQGWENFVRETSPKFSCLRVGVSVGCCHVHEWAGDPTREEVPTVSEMHDRILAAANANGAVSACVQGTALPVWPLLTRVDGGRVFTVVRPWSTTPAPAVKPQLTLHKYQDMTRIDAAAGGVSGSPPAWDPV
jgi:hypothetical protein